LWMHCTVSFLICCIADNLSEVYKKFNLTSYSYRYRPLDPTSTK
jgi:hypothetical protein